MIDPPVLCFIQGVYFLVTGVWPLVSIRTFEAVTGPKVDDWLVKTLGVPVAVVGAVLLLAGYRGQAGLEVTPLAVGCAPGLRAIDVCYASGRVISKIHPADATAELILVGLWAMARSAWA